MATPKQKLVAHIRAFHHKGWVPTLTYEGLGKWHATQHHRFHTNHTHEGVNLGAGDRPPGWRTGEGVVVK